MVRRKQNMRRRYRHVEPLTEAEKLFLGAGWFGNSYVFATVGQAEAMWTAHRDELRADFAETNGPGRRHYCEYLFELVPKYGDRIVFDADGIDADAPGWRPHGILKVRDHSAVESETDYLRRIGELTADEEAELLEVL